MRDSLGKMAMQEDLGVKMLCGSILRRELLVVQLYDMLIYSHVLKNAIV